MAAINNDWLEALQGEFKKPYYKKLFETVNEEYRTRQIFPPADDIFNAFHLTPLHKVKVVILGQDPYHNVGQAHGLCFSVKKGVDIPPSLVNIYKELHDDLGCTIPSHGCLTKWAETGSINAKHGVDCARASGELSQRNWMGRIHRCSNSGSEQSGQTDCLYSVGSSCAKEEENAYESKASYPGSTASKPAGCLQRFSLEASHSVRQMHFWRRMGLSRLTGRLSKLWE